MVCGHTRLQAAKKLGWTEVPCVIADDLNEEQIKAFRLADNKVSEFSEWNFDFLDLELNDITGIDMSAFGFEEPDNAEVDEDDFELDELADPIAKKGDIWILGNHRLMCGDSTSEADVDKLMDGNLADLVVTDPPYNVAIENSDGLTIANDNMSSEQFHEFLYKAFKNLNRALKPSGAFYVWFASKKHINFEQALNENGLTVRQELIWNKNSLALSRQDYQWKHEPCLYGWKEGGGAHYFIDARDYTTVIEDKRLNYKNLKKPELIALLDELFSSDRPTTIIDAPKPAKDDLHPTMKPLKLIGQQVRNSSRPGEKVLDLFGGSGSTLMACEQLSRVCYTMEYDERYVDAIVRRWEKYTGLEAQCIRE